MPAGTDPAVIMKDNQQMRAQRDSFLNMVNSDKLLDKKAWSAEDVEELASRVLNLIDTMWVLVEWEKTKVKYSLEPLGPLLQEAELGGVAYVADWFSANVFTVYTNRLSAAFFAGGRTRLGRGGRKRETEEYTPLERCYLGAAEGAASLTEDEQMYALSGAAEERVPTHIADEYLMESPFTYARRRDDESGCYHLTIDELLHVDISLLLHIGEMAARRDE